MLAELRNQYQQQAVLVHPDADIIAQLQVVFQDIGIVVSAHFGSEAIQRGGSFEEWGIEDGATVGVALVSVDELTNASYLELDAEVQAELEALLQ